MLNNICFIDEYKKVLDDHKEKFEQLENICKSTGEKVEGNCFTEHLNIDNKISSLIYKQCNHFSLGSISNNIMEIGFNAGHSSLLYLLSNSNSKLTIFDICEHKYTIKCFEYLCSIFPNRLRIYKGDSTKTIPEFFQNNPTEKFDLIHIDGCHTFDIAKKDFYNSIKLASDIIIWDDTQISYLNNMFDYFIQQGLVYEISLYNTYIYKHRICRINPLLNNTYIWEQSYIKFLPNSEMDAFGYGKYRFLDKYLVNCIFGGREHILKFNKDYSKFLSIRKDDGNVVNGYKELDMIAGENLLYFAVSGSNYLDIFRLCLKSASQEIKDKNIHVLCITEKDLENDVRSILKENLCDNYFIYCPKYKIGILHNFNIKLNIVDFEYLYKYKRIVFSDSDVIFSPGSISPLFNVIRNPNTMYVKPEHLSLLLAHFYTDYIYTKEELDKIQKSPKNTPINTGHFGWLNGEYITEQFKKVINHINYVDKNREKSSYDQVFLNRQWLLDQNIEYLYDKLVSISPERDFCYNKNIIYHFTYIKKLERMRTILRSMNKVFYVCSYGGCGSKNLCNALSNYGKVKHIHSRNPPEKLEYIGNEKGGNTYFEWFNGISIPEDELCNYYVIYIYKNPVKSILSRFEMPQHLKNIEIDENIKLDEVLESGKDLYKIQEFYNNYTQNNKNRNYKIYAVKYEEIFDKQDKLSNVLGVGSLNLIKKETKREPNMKLELIYKELINEMNQNDFIKIC
jgi:hypothetical protein